MKAIGYLLWGIYKLILGCWLEPILNRSFRRAFAEDIRRAMPFLFERYGAKIIRDPSPESNDPYQDYVTLGASNLVFKFSKWRDENFAIDVSPTYAPGDSRKLVDAIRAVNPAEKATGSISDVSWRPWGKILEPNFALLQEAFKEDNYAATKEKVSQVG